MDEHKAAVWAVKAYASVSIMASYPGVDSATISQLLKLMDEAPAVIQRAGAKVATQAYVKNLENNG